MAGPISAGIAGHIQGLREAKAAFQALPQIARENLLVATETTVQQIARTAQGKLQSSPSIQTRNLYNSVAWAITKTSGLGRVGIKSGTTTISVGSRKVKVRGIVRAGVGGSALKSAGARFDNPAKRAKFIEFGTRKMRAEPFMIPAAESQKQPYLDRCIRAGKGIETDMAAIGLRNL